MASDTVAEETEAFRRFIADFPGLASKAKQYDLKARQTLKARYVDFEQGTYAVIKARSEATPANKVEHSERMPTKSEAENQASEGNHLQTPESRQSDDKNDEEQKRKGKKYCPKCGQNRWDINRHLETHNKDPGPSVYCPVDTCLERMARNDPVTCVEHLLNKHLDWIFAGGVRPVHHVVRYRIFRLTMDTKYLRRLNQAAIARLTELDQDDLRNYISPHTHINQLVGGFEDFDIFPLQNVINTKGLAYDNDGLATANEIQNMTKDEGIEYLLALRGLMRQINKDLGEIAAELEGVNATAKTTTKSKPKSKPKGVSKRMSKSVSKGVYKVSKSASKSKK